MSVEGVGRLVTAGAVVAAEEAREAARLNDIAESTKAAKAAFAAGAYEEALAKYVLKPLGALNATFDTRAALSSDDVAIGYAEDGSALNLLWPRGGA